MSESFVSSGLRKTAQVLSDAEKAQVQENLGTTQALAAKTTIIATIASMRTMTVPYPAGLTLLGYYAAGDKSAVTYRWSYVSTAPDNGGTVIRPTEITNGSAGRWLLNCDPSILSANDFGAKGDNISDDLTAINAAIAALPDSGQQIEATGYPYTTSGGITYGKKGTILFTSASYRTSGEILVSPLLRLISPTRSILTFLPGAAPSSGSEKFVIRCIYGIGSVTSPGNPNLCFDTVVDGFTVSSGTVAQNPGGSGVFYLGANIGGFQNCIIGECALRGAVINCQGGSVNNVSVFGTVHRGPGLETLSGSEQMVIGRMTVEHVNSDPLNVYRDSDGDPIPAVLLRGRNHVIGSIQTEESPLSLKIDGLLGLSMGAIFANPNTGAATAGAGLVRIQGASQLIDIRILGSVISLPYLVRDTSSASGVSYDVTYSTNRGSYRQQDYVENLSVTHLAVNTIGLMQLWHTTFTDTYARKNWGVLSDVTEVGEWILAVSGGSALANAAPNIAVISAFADLRVKLHGDVDMPAIPTADPGVAGRVWCDLSDARRLKLSAG